jgi:phage-related protein
MLLASCGSHYQLGRVQQRLMPDDWKAMTTVGSGVYEIRIHTELEHRVLYVAKYEDAVYVIHAFERRTRQTSDADIALARQRLADFLRPRAHRKKETR